MRGKIIVTLVFLTRTYAKVLFVFAYFTFKTARQLEKNCRTG
ncbi:Hypothetical protein CpMEX30_0397 [Corynebacterium pseudotuberculosis]|nr:Hypothetical protein CpPAT10_0371a [Corynebacterium pseudotuberculosis PAT10]AEX38842.1 Hypothetical protein Cp3995_0370 [Corynebacterium pseudotuberculosis 3/99-5]AFF21526.1 Hypothetical protein CpP54B96_0371 [Corynebacterium pseudotuberculosis P54B96]AFH51290.1 Hypothetical protein Cp267_0382 [Corynebacterium pseudotuberculosis 267]AIG06731.1 hypothetical protein CPTA_00902 [Corynebacterium pseudotuberculosis]